MQSSISGYRKQALNQAGPEVLPRGSVISPILHLTDGDVSSFLVYFTSNTKVYSCSNNDDQYPSKKNTIMIFLFQCFYRLDPHFIFKLIYQWIIVAQTLLSVTVISILFCREIFPSCSYNVPLENDKHKHRIEETRQHVLENTLALFVGKSLFDI